MLSENWKASLPKITVSSLGRSKEKDGKVERTFQTERKLEEVGGIGAHFSDLEVFQGREIEESERVRVVGEVVGVKNDGFQFGAIGDVECAR